MTEGDRYAQRARYRLSRCPRPGEPVTVLLHGLGGSAEQPLAFVPDAYDQPVLAPDLRGHGETTHVGPPEAFTFAGLAADIRALLDRLAITGPLVVGGVSMGAGVALRLARAMPKRVRGLLAIRPAWRDHPLPPNLIAYPTIADLLRRLGPRTGLATFVDLPEYRCVLDESPAAARSMRDQFTASHAVARAARLDRMPRSTPYDHETDLARITCPAVVVGARGDPVHPLTMAEAWARSLGSANLVEVGARDQDPAAQADQIRTATADFLAALAMGRR